MTLRKFGPKMPDHPTVGGLCPACHMAFKEGDYTCLVMLGPGDNLEARALARAGRPYTAVAVEVHWGCGTGKLDNVE